MSARSLSSEETNDFDISKIKVTNGTLSGFSGISKIYVAILTIGTDGLCTVEVEANKFTDTVGNPNSASNQFNLTLDSTYPTMTITSSTVSSGDTTNDSSIDLTFTSSEATTDFGEGNITLTNGSLSNFNKTSSTVYTATLTPTADGECTVEVATREFTDNIGNLNNASNKFIWTYDSTSPIITITSDTVSSGDTTNDSTINLTFNSSEITTDFVESDITVTNGSLSGFSGSSKVYTATLTPIEEDISTVDIAANVFTDAVGNSNTSSNQFTWTYDKKRPTITIASSTVSSGDTTNNSSIELTFTLSEATTDFAKSDITVSNGSLSNFSGSSNVYTAILTPIAVGLCTVDVLANVFTNTVGNSNIAATQFTWTYEGTSLETATTTTSATPTTATPAPSIVYLPAPAPAPATTTTTNSSGGGISISLILTIILIVIIYMLLKN